MAYQPKSYKKFVATAATAALVASAVAPVASANVTTADFEDVSSNYKDAIDYLVANNITKGYTETEFGVTRDIKRGDAAIILANALGVNDPEAADSGFVDVPTRGVLAINSLKAAGVVSGKTETTFDFDSNITRGEMALLLARANAYNLSGDASDLPFVDVNSNYATSVAGLLEAGITLGKTETLFGTTDTLTRGEFALFIYRAEGSPAHEEPVVTSVSTINDITIVEGEEVVLPETVEVTYDDESSEEVAVTWNSDEFDFTKAGTYELTGTIEDTELTASVTVVVEALTPEVSSVTAINAKEVEVKFNQAVDKSTVLDGSNTVLNMTFSPVGTANATGPLKGSLSADGKTLTVTAATFFKGSYTVVATDDIKTTDGEAIEEMKSVVSFEDSLRPSVGNAVYKTNNVATFTFSEPMDVANDAALASALTLKDASGATYTPTVVLAADKKSFTLNLNASAFETGKMYTLTMTSLKDFAGNLISPNPTTLSVEKKVIDNVAPVVSSVSSNQAGYVVVNFSEKVSANANNEVAVVGGITADLDTNATLDASGTVLTVRNASFNGTKDITVNTFKDVAGNAGSAKTVLVNFPVDSVKPTVSSSSVQVIDNKNYLVLTFSEDVSVTNAAGTITGNYVTENGVEKTVTPIDTSVPANVSLVSGMKNQVKVLIDSQEKGTYNVSLPANVVTDVVGNQNAVASVGYSVGANTSETIKPTITDSTPLTADLDGINIQAADNNTIEIGFSEKLSTSSLDLNNFLVEGAVVASKAVFTNDNRDIIKLTLKEGAIKTSGTYNFTVRNVSDVAGNVMNSVTQAKSFDENDLPGLTAAALTSNDTAAGSAVITLTFDEAIDSSTVAEVGPVADFEVYIDGVLTTANVAEAMGASTNKVTLTLNRALTSTEASKTITLKPAAGFDVADLEGNVHPKFTSVTVTK